jgi:cytidylate kinase
MNYKNIAISGAIGTGKTTLANNLSKKLRFKHLSTGEFIRDWYKTHNIDLNKTDEIPEDLDRKIDHDFQEKMGQEQDLVFESRLAGWLARDLKQVFKVLVTADYTETVKRAAKRDGTSFDKEFDRARERDEGLRNKFKRLYQTDDYLDPKYFDLVVDTTTKTPEEILEIVLKELNK